MTDRNAVLEQLKNLLAVQFNEVQTRFGLPSAYVRQAAAQAEQALDLLRYAEQRPEGLACLDSLIAEVLPRSDAMLLDKAQLAALRNGLFERMAELSDTVQLLGTYLKQIEKQGVAKHQAFVFEIVSQFLLNTPDALPVEKFGEFCRTQLAHNAAALDYPDLARRLRQGDIALFIGLEQSVLLTQLAQTQSARSLAEWCEYAETQGSRREIARQVVNIQMPATLTGLYELIAGLSEPLLIFHAGYDSLLEQALQQHGKRYAVVFHDLGKGGLEVLYSDRSETQHCGEEDFSRLSLMENGYNLIYRLRGVFRNADEEWLVLAEQDYLRWFKSAKIPDYITVRLRKRSLWFLGHSPNAWEERLLNYIVLDARGANTPGNLLAIHQDSDAFTTAYWEKRHKTHKHTLDLREFVSKLQGCCG